MLNILLKTHFTNNIFNILQTGIRHHCEFPTVAMNNGNEMPAIGFGTWSSTNDFRMIEKVDNPGQQKTDKKSEGEQIKKNSKIVAKAVEMAIDAGYRHIDGAHLYKNEREIGQVYKEKIKCGVVTRKDLFITSKLWNTFHDPENVITACKNTLANLGLDYLDMYLMHTPMGFKYSKDDLFPTCNGELLNSEVDYIDTWLAMEELVKKKMCKSIGISNFNIEQIKRLLTKCKIVPQTLQIEIHPYLAQKDLIDFVKCEGISLTAYSPLGSPRRPWAKEIKQKELLTDDKILKLAETHKRTPAQILLRYQIQRGHAVIPAATEKNHIEENLNIFDFELCPEDLKIIESLNSDTRYFYFSGAYGHPHHPFKTSKC